MDLVSKAISTRNRRIALWVALAVVAVLLILPAPGWPSWGQDEGTYTSQALAVLNGKLSWSTYWYDHPPLGWILLSVPMWLLSFVVGDFVTAARIVSAIAVAVSLAMVYGISYRLSGRRWVSLAAPLFMVTSFLTWGVFRMVYLDTYAVPLVLTGIFLVLDPRRRLWAMVLGALALAMGILSKETFLLMVPGIFYLVWQRQTDRDPEVRRILRPFAVTAFVAMGLAVLSLYPTMAAMKKELLHSETQVSLWDAVVFQLGSRSGSGTLFTSGSERQHLWLAWMADDRALVFLLVATLGLVFVRRWRWLPVATVGFLLPAVVGSGYLPVMHVIGMVPLAALSVAAWLDVVVTAAPRRLTPAIASVAVVGILFGGVARADDVSSRVGGDANALNRHVIAWMANNANTNKSVLVDGSLIVQVSEKGWSLSEDASGGQAIPHEKIDLDPKFAAKLGPCAIGYVIVTAQVRQDMDSLSLNKLKDFIDSSSTVWSEGGVEIREAPKCP